MRLSSSTHRDASWAARLKSRPLRAAALAILLSALAPALTASSPAAPASASTNSAADCQGPGDFGTVYLGSTWPGGFQGVPVYSNGISGSFTDCLHSTRTPSGKTVLDGYEWQCVELVVRLYLTKGWINSTWLGDGDQMYSTAPSFLKRQPQGSITSVAPGDVISFNYAGGGAGHAAVISRVQGNYLTIVNQNTNRSAVISNANLVNGSIEMVGWPGWYPIGVIDAPNTAPPPLSVTTASLSNERINDPYSASLSAHGGSGRDLWSLAGGRLPAGLTLWNWGVISGTVLSTGTYSFTVAVKDAKGTEATRRLSLSVQANSNMLGDPNFVRPGTAEWHHLGRKSQLRVVHRVPGVPGSSKRGDELELYSPASGGSVYQDVTAPIADGASFTFGTWVRSLASPTRVCAVLFGLPHLQSDSTCTTASSTWTHLLVPYDATLPNEHVLRVQLYVGGAGGRVALARTELSGNGLWYASFESRRTTRWVTLGTARGEKVTAVAYRAAGLPEGADYLKLSSPLPGGTVLQNVSADLPAAQSFRFVAWVKETSSGSLLEPAEVSVCLVVRGLGSTQSSSRCTEVSATWTQLSVPFVVRHSGETGLRAEVVIHSAFSAIAVDGTMLVNAA